MASIDDKDFETEFSDFNISPDNPSVYDKMRYLCQKHGISAATMACEWMAFVQSKPNSSLNEEMLDMLERENLSKKNSKPTKTPVRGIQKKSYSVNSKDRMKEAGNEVLDLYATPKNKESTRLQFSPESVCNKNIKTASLFSPTSFSPVQGSTPSRSYGRRSNAGQVVCSFGATDNTEWSNESNKLVNISLYGSNSTHLTHKFKYMFQKLSDKAQVLNDTVDEMGDFLRKHYGIEEELSHVALPAQEVVAVVGRICCDTVGKLNSQSVMLEGSLQTSAGSMIPFDLSNLTHYSLFPGQVVMADGINTTATKFVAKKLYEGAVLPFSERPVDLLDGPVSIVVAAGPFTTSDSLMHEPLADLVKYLRKHSPDVCILIGPFLDWKQPNIKDLEEEYGTFFKRNIVEYLVDTTSQMKTQLVLVPSYRDVHHTSVYPQPPYTVSSHDKVKVVCDPCTLDIDGIVVGVTSTDILLHLGQEETSSSVGGDRLARLTQHILTQHNYYPLDPPHEEVPFSYDQFDQFGFMSCTPHVFIVPSDLRYFVKDIQGCCCVNPGRVAKGQVGGTFARVVIQPPGGDSAGKSLSSAINAQVLKI